MSSKSKFENYTVVENRRHFMLVHKPDSDPFNEEESQYYLVFKKYATIEAKANSFIIATQMLSEAEDMYQTVRSRATEQGNEKEVKKPTLQ